LRDQRRAFADAGDDALDRARADVADGEDAGSGGFQRERSAAGQDEAPREAIIRNVLAGRDPWGDAEASNELFPEPRR